MKAIEDLTGLDMKKHTKEALKTLVVGHATVQEAIVMSLVDDKEISNAERKKRVEACFNNIQKAEKKMGLSIQNCMNKAVIAKASSVITS